MTLAVGAAASSCNLMGFDGEKGSKVLEKTEAHPPESDDEAVQTLSRQASKSSLYTTEEEDADDDDDHSSKLQLGPQCTLKEYLEKDKDDESLRRWKEQLLGCVDLEKIGVDSARQMLGTFSPQLEAYTHQMPEETTPSGFSSRGIHSAKSKFVDDDNRYYLEINYSFDIRKEWAAT